MEFAPVEKVLLAVAVLASLGVFALHLAQRLRLVAAGPRDRPRTDRLDERLAVTIEEVLFQTRVVRGRPVVGVLHAIVFLGFVAFGLVTLDHFAQGFGSGFLAPLLGSALPLFERGMAIVSAAVAVAIAGLAFRRFAMKRISPDPKSWSSAVVSSFIFVLMLTYLNALAPHPLWPKANWWLHAGIILVFPHVILRSKHLHLLLSPVTIFFRTLRLGDLLPLALDEESLARDDAKLGLETMHEVPWKMRLDFLTCVECRRCTDQCPANGAGQELDPRGFVLAGRRSLFQLGEDAAVIGNVIGEVALGQCTSCGACENACPVGIEHLQLLIGAKRTQALALGTGMVAGKFLETIERYGNPFAARAETRATLVRDLGIPAFVPGTTEWLLWLGCVWGYNEDARSAATAMVDVLREAGVSFGVLAEEACCGHHSRRQGEEMQFQTLARQNIETLTASRVEKIVTPCPHCLHSLRREYPTLAADFAPNVVHHSELLGELIARGALRLAPRDAAAPLTTFHDPCYLGRYEGVYDPPREVLAAAGIELVELGRRRERSYCCGGGNAGFAREQDVPRRVDQVRKEEIVASGARRLVTACPECKMMLGAAVERTEDLAEVVAGAMVRRSAVSA